MTRFLLPAALAVALLIGSGGNLRADPDRYLCISEYSAGVDYSQQTKTWGPRIFGPRHKYILRRLLGDEREGKFPTGAGGIGTFEGVMREGSEWGFFLFGEQWPRATCDASFDCQSKYPFLTLHFSSATGRYEASQLSGYTYQTELADKPLPDPKNEKIRQSVMNHPDSGSVEIGTCGAL
jgi:hypothetical protein